MMEHVLRAEQHAIEGERHLALQGEIVATLESACHNTTQALRLLAQFEEIQALHIANRDRLRNAFEP